MNEHDKAARLVQRSLQTLGGTLGAGVTVALIDWFANPDLTIDITVALFRNGYAINHLKIIADPFGEDRPQIFTLPL